MMKKIIASLLMLILAVVLSVSVFAEVKHAEIIPMAEKVPVNTPNFVPELDGIKDAGYTVDTPVIAPNPWGALHSTTVTISTAWNGNTLYFYIYVPDTTPQDSVEGLAMYQRDGVWFVLDFFDGDYEAVKPAKTVKTVRAFKVLTGVEDLQFCTPVHEDFIKPVNAEDVMYKIEWDDNGYGLEVAYTVPADLSTLVANQNIAFDVEVFDVNSGTNYRYHINNGDAAVESYSSAYSAKLVLAEAPAAEEPPVEEPPVEEPAPETADAALSLAIVAVVAAAATGVVLKKKHF